MITALDTEPGLLVTSEAAAQEADYLIGARLGVDVELAFLEDLAAGTYEVACLDLAERRVAADLAARHRDLRLGFADATLVVLAGRYATTRILTLNERDFRVVAPLQGGAFVLLPVGARD